MYRAFPVDATGHVCGPPQAFIAKSDIEAIAQAMTFADTQAVEVWDHERRVGLIERQPDED